jgi:hypothetical protein
MTYQLWSGSHPDCCAECIVFDSRLAGWFQHNIFVWRQLNTFRGDMPLAYLTPRLLLTHSQSRKETERIYSKFRFGSRTNLILVPVVIPTPSAFKARPRMFKITLKMYRMWTNINRMKTVADVRSIYLCVVRFTKYRQTYSVYVVEYMCHVINCARNERARVAQSVLWLPYGRHAFPNRRNKFSSVKSQ